MRLTKNKYFLFYQPYLFFMVLAFCTQAPASARSFRPSENCRPTTAEREFQRASAVFLGKVISKRHLPGSFDLTRGLVLFQVVETFKGDLGDRAEVFALPSFYGRFPFHHKQTYLVYAIAEDPYPLVVGDCTHSSPSTNKNAELATLRQLGKSLQKP